MGVANGEPGAHALASAPLKELRPKRAPSTDGRVPAPPVRSSAAWRPLFALIAAAIGVAAVVFGGYDDSPGLQGLGVLVVVGAIALGVTARRGT